MTIRKCPHCLQLNHFDGESTLAPCWRCKAWSDFAQIRTFGQKFVGTTDAVISAHLPDLIASRWNYYGKLGLLAALPIVVLMLLICNSFNIHIVTNLVNSFHSLQVVPFSECFNDYLGR